MELSSISKVMEKIVYEQVAKYFEENKLIYEFQSGFRSGHPTPLTHAFSI